MSRITRPNGRLLDRWKDWEIWEVQPTNDIEADLWANLKVLRPNGRRRCGQARVFYLGWSFDEARLARSHASYRLQDEQPELSAHILGLLRRVLTPEYAVSSGWPYRRDPAAVAAAKEASAQRAADRIARRALLQSA